MKRRAEAHQRPQRGERGPNRGGHSVRRNRVLALVILAILALAAVAPAGQASSPASGERSAERAALKAEHAAEHEAIRLERQSVRAAKREGLEAERQAKHESRVAIRLANKISEHAAVTIQCKQIVVEYKGFNAIPENLNAVSEKVVFKLAPAPLLTLVFAPNLFTFPGTSATTTIPIMAPLGHSRVGIRARFKSNGVKGSFAVSEPLTCGPTSAFTMTTTQSLGGPFTTEPIPGSVGQTVDYQTVATNTGNTPLTFTGFSNPGCDSTPAGGSAAPVPPRGTMTFVCTHRLTEADRTAGVLADAASVTAAAASGETPVTPVLHTTAAVLVTPIGSGQEAAQAPTVITNTIIKEVTTSSGSSSSTNAKTGVASSKAVSPSLHGPKGCFRSRFTASVTSSGVSSVVFYVDGHRVVRRTSHSTSNGMIAIGIDGSKLKAGIHRLLAKITMIPSPPSAKAATTSRSMTIRRCRTGAATLHHS